MKKPIKMPALSDTMDKGRLVRWLKAPGDAVEKGDSLAEVETDKAATEMEAFEAGYLAGPLAAADAEYPVGTTLAWLTDEVETAPSQAQERNRDQQQPPAQRHEAGGTREQRPLDEAARAAAVRERPESEKAGEETELRATEPGREAEAPSPVVAQALAGRSLAAQRTVAKTMKETEAALVHQIEAGPPFEVTPQDRLRQVIAETVSFATHTPQFRISARVDLEGLRGHAQEEQRSMSVLLARACALTVKEYPLFNAAWTPEGLAQRKRVDVSIAMEAERSLLTPVLRDVADRPLKQVEDAWRALKDKIDRRRSSPDDYRGATFYLSNLGMFEGVLQFDAIVPAGAAAILAVAAPASDGTVLTLTCDHRVVFGTDAARFLATLGERLSDPQRWTE
jgi:pyruvate dehydrogenase E2 component (dihydrolipoamide acetyltransferase)